MLLRLSLFFPKKLAQQGIVHVVVTLIHKSWKAMMDLGSGSQKRHFSIFRGLMVSWLLAVAYRKCVQKCNCPSQVRVLVCMDVCVRVCICFCFHRTECGGPGLSTKRKLDTSGWNSYGLFSSLNRAV